MNVPTEKKSQRFAAAFWVVTSLFFMWGFITVLVDSLVPRLKEVFEISYGTAGLLQFAFFLAYFIVALPAGQILSKTGYKRGMMLGLGVMSLGCLLYWPAASLRMFPLFLMAFFTLAGGMAILQVAANPYVAVLGSEQTAASRLNLAQALNSMGTAIAPLIGAKFLLSDHIKKGDDIAVMDAAEKAAYYALEASAVQMPFVILAGALFVLVLIIFAVKLPKVLGSTVSGRYSEAFGFPHLKFGALAIFLYVGAEVAIGTYAANYFVSMGLADMVRSSESLEWLVSLLFKEALSEVDDKGVMQGFVSLYWLGAMVGRFLGSVITGRYAPARVISIFGTAAVMLVAISALSGGWVAMWSLLAVGLFNSIMFPTIFTESIDRLGDLKPQGSGILVAAILGGGIIPPLYGWLTDMMSFKPAFVLIMLCYAIIVLFGYLVPRLKPSVTPS